MRAAAKHGAEAAGTQDFHDLILVQIEWGMFVSIQFDREQQR